MAHFFVTGIGTEVGKTLIAAIITEALQADYFKPIQAGDLAYSDTFKVKKLVANKKSNFFPNSFALQTPMSPHESARIDGVLINKDSIKRPNTTNHLVIEGAGGLLVPINEKECIIDLIQPTDITILVSRHYLGSINHTLLSVEALKNRGLKNIALIFNGNENPSSEYIIAKKTSIPIIGRVEEESEITPTIISKYAYLFASKLKELL